MSIFKVSIFIKLLTQISEFLETFLLGLLNQKSLTNQKINLFERSRDLLYIHQWPFLYEKGRFYLSFWQWRLIYLPFLYLNEHISFQRPHFIKKIIALSCVVYSFGIFDQEARADEDQTCQVRSFIEGNVKSSCRSSASHKGISNKVTAPTLLVFISTSMPKLSIEHLLIQVDKVGGVLVMRGLINNSFKETAAYMKELKAGLWIDPTLFKAFNIVQVPTFVVLEKPFVQGLVVKHEKLSGNVSLDFALEKISKESVKAQELLLKLRSNKR